MSSLEEPLTGQPNGSPRQAAIPEPVQNGDEPLDDDDDDDENNNDNDNDLFGDDDNEEDDEIKASSKSQRRTLDDAELDSGDDVGRIDRVADTVEDEGDIEQKPLRLLDSDVARIKYPEGDDFYVLNMPPFLGLRHQNFDSETYEVPKQPHDGREDPTFSWTPYSTAMTSMYWRRDPQAPEKLQSTGRMIKWSDGSMTLQLATKPQEQYRIATTAMRQSFGKKATAGVPYDPSKDSQMFLAAAHGTQGVDLQIVRPVDASMKILPSGDQADESVLRLEQSLAAMKEIHDPFARMREIKEDPEKAKKSAEEAEKELARARRKRENAEDRLLLRRDRVLGRAGVGGRVGGAGLSIEGLEDDVGMPISRGTMKKRRPTNRRGEIYSDDEDETLPRGRTREDEYDREDDFLASSDEEPETYEDGNGEEEEVLEEDEDNDDLEIDGRKTVLETRTRKEGRGRDGTPKRTRMDEIEEEDAEGEPDEEYARQSPQVRKKRRVIDDDEDEDDE